MADRKVGWCLLLCIASCSESSYLELWVDSPIAVGAKVSVTSPGELRAIPSP